MIVVIGDWAGFFGFVLGLGDAVLGGLVLLVQLVELPHGLELFLGCQSLQL